MQKWTYLALGRPYGWALNFKDCEDILRAIADIDANFGEAEKPVIFVSRNLRNLPHVSPGDFDTPAILTRLARLERQMSSMQQAKTTYAQATSPTTAGNAPATDNALPPGLIAGRDVPSTQPTTVPMSALAMPAKCVSLSPTARLDATTNEADTPTETATKTRPVPATLSRTTILSSATSSALTGGSRQWPSCEFDLQVALPPTDSEPANPGDVECFTNTNKYICIHHSKN